MRALKFIFFFLFLTPNQAENNSNIQEKEGSNDQNSSFQVAQAAVSETIQFGKLRSDKRYKKYQSKKHLQMHGMQGIEGDLARKDLLLAGSSTKIQKQVIAFIPEQLLKFCYRSKSKSLDWEGSGLA